MNQDEAIQRAMEEILNDMSQEIQEEIRTGRHHYPTMKERQQLEKELAPLAQMYLEKEDHCSDS